MNERFTPFSVGLLVIGSVVAFVFMFGQVGQSLRQDADGGSYYAIFRDVSGLAEKSRVTIAGINVGFIERIELAGDKARVWLRIRTPLKTDAQVHKKQASLLGEYFLQLTPGYTGRPLRDGDRIMQVIYDTNPADLMRDLQNIAGNVVEITQSLRRVISGEGGEQKLLDILENFRQTAADLRMAVGKNSGKLDLVVDNVVAVTGEARSFSTDFRADARVILRDARAITGSVKDIIGENSENFQEGFEGVKGALARLQSALTRLDNTLSRTESISAKIDEGQGTIGRLVNDDELIDNMNTLVEESGRFVTQFTRLQTVVAMRSDFYLGRGTVRNELELRLQPRNDKYYSLSLIDDPRGVTRLNQRVTNSSDSLSDPVIREQESLTEDRFRLSLQFARRFLFVTGRVGVIENTGGIGFDIHLLGDTLEMSTDLFAFNDNVNPRMRTSALYNFFSHLYIAAGVDEIWNSEQTDVYMGLGLRFDDEDLQAILVTAPSPSF